MTTKRCAAEGCEDRGFLLLRGERLCEPHFAIRQDQPREALPSFEGLTDEARIIERQRLEIKHLQQRIVMLLKCHYDEHKHFGSPTCFDVQSPADEWETRALSGVLWR